MLLCAGLLTAVLWQPHPARAQSNQLGGQSCADAASRTFVLGVQLGMSSLPPMSGQAVTYEYDPATESFVRSEPLGPTAFRSAETAGQGRGASA